MSKKNKTEQETETFGRRLARLRKLAGLTQKELGAELGISQRVVAYYEGETKRPPVALLPQLAGIFGVSTDELLGLKSREDKAMPDNRLWRRFKDIEKLPPQRRREILKVVDLLLEGENLRKQASTKA